MSSINVLALVRDEERYVFLYDDQSANKLLQTLGEFAADPDLSFSWYDAAFLSQRVRAVANEYREKFPNPDCEGRSPE